MMMISHISDHSFLFLQLEQPRAAVEPYFLRMFSPFSTFPTSFTFSDDKFLGFLLLHGISGCLWLLDTPSCPSKMLTALLKDAAGSQAHSPAGMSSFSTHVLLSISLLATSLHFRAAHIKSPLQIFCVVLSTKPEKSYVRG